jgi:hypothetical protein
MKFSEGLSLGIPRNDPVIRWLNIVAFCILAAIALTACNSTVRPALVEPAQASYDGNEQNSGILGADPAGGGYLITAHARDRYNALVETYGRDFAPALTRDAGISKTEGGYVITREYLVKFLEMNRWRKSGLAPAKS